MWAMPDPKPKRKVIDYAGLAALVTAIAGVLGMVWKQAQAEDTSAMVQDSALVLIEHRLGVVEREAADLRARVRVAELELAKSLGKPMPPSPITLAPSGAGGGPGGVSVAISGPDQGGGEQSAEEALGALVGKARRRAPVRVKDIRQYVEKSNRSLRLEDF